MGGYDGARNEQAETDAPPRARPVAASKRFEHERQHIVGNWRAAVMDGEGDGLPVFAPRENNGRAFAMLYRVPDEVRHHLGEAVGVPLAAQIPGGLKSHDGVGLAGTNLDQRLLAHLLKIGRASIQRN